MRPTPRCLLFLLIGFGAALVPVLLGARLWTVWAGWLAVVAMLAGLDALLAVPRARLAVSWEAPRQIFVGDEGALGLRLGGRRWPLPFRVRVVADVEGDVLPPPERIARVPVGGPGTVEMPLRPLRRGTFAVRRLWLRWTGPFGLMSRWARRAIEEEVAVVPNVRAVRATALEFFRTRDAFVGTKVVRHEGEGSEFEALREYVPGLDARTLNWKASARHRMLVAQEYRAERNHQAVIALDTGYLMREPLGGIPKLDHAIHCGLVLGYAALRTGDRVGLHAFDERPHAFAEPRGGVHTFSRLQHATTSLGYTTAETNFTLGLTDLSTRLRRRSLVVLLTDFVDTVTAELMLDNVSRLARRHLVVFVTLRDPHLEAEEQQAPASLDALYRSVVAHDFVRERELVLRRLRRLGVYCIDAPPQAVSPRLLNRYLEIKRRELV